MTLISKEKVIDELVEFSNQMTGIGGSYVRSAVHLVVMPMEEAQEATDLKHKLAVQDATVKKLFERLAEGDDLK